eukprot:TRINITY_DN5182_c1_g1_i1.p1 TRINITY_DN5182_c1_g1~~TRINITY_DN5182_c1_g1_i1.p1  ORF type:complete len:161 (-),score=22.58 TRINITY_DN5182_c1_g1_i1:143-625(-)
MCSLDVFRALLWPLRTFPQARKAVSADTSMHQHLQQQHQQHQQQQQQCQQGQGRCELIAGSTTTTAAPDQQAQGRCELIAGSTTTAVPDQQEQGRCELIAGSTTIIATATPTTIRNHYHYNQGRCETFRRLLIFYQATNHALLQLLSLLSLLLLPFLHSS